jgi:hypothetical protein
MRGLTYLFAIMCFAWFLAFACLSTAKERSSAETTAESNLIGSGGF